MDWTLAQLRAKVRELTGQRSTSQLSDADLTDKINDFYCNVFPDEVELPELKGFYSFSTVQGDGEYALPSTVLRIKKPITKLAGTNALIKVYEGGKKVKVRIPAPDGNGFANAEVSDFVAGAAQPTARSTTAVGTVVRPSTHNGFVYECTASAGVLGTEPVWPTTPGESVSDGTNTWICRREDVVFEKAADDGNGDAVARLGFWKDANAFFTEYPDDASASQNAPLDLLQYGSNLYLRPIPDGVYTVKAAAVQRPAALVEGTDTVINPKWGPAIAYGTAIQMFIDQKDSAGADELTGIYQVHLNSIGRKHLQQLSAFRSVPSF
jgi:hypothetical protein